MNNKWIPDWASFYTITRTGENSEGLLVRFHILEEIVGCRHISNLAHDLAIADVCSQIREKPLSERITPQSKYHKEIKPGVIVDWYDVAAAFSPNPSKMWEKVFGAVHHAHKKLCRLGSGDKELRQDLVEARDSLDRAIQQFDEWC